MSSNKIKILKDVILNFSLNRKYDLFYVVEPTNWSIKWDGEYITKNLNKSGLIKARITTIYLLLRNQIIHFGSLNTFLTNKKFRKPHWSNKIVVTCFHLVPNDARLRVVKEAKKYVNFFHTTCNITKTSLVDLGVNPEKIVVIPLGVDLSLFKPVSFEKKQEMKRQLGIPLDRIIIGSFQKDGVGWGKGLEPKLIKGPDVFIKVAEKLGKNYPIFVLLIGPARGYVKLNLEKKNIPYKSIGYLSDFKEVAKYYQALDLYLITSRIEGGPKAILESMASGVPVVSTKVGMVPDIVKDGKQVLLSDVEDIDQIANKSEKIITTKGLKKELMENGLRIAQNYSWEKITRRYYEKIYKRLL